MTLTFPRELPSGEFENVFENCDFELVRQDAVNRAGGRLLTNALFDPYWRAKVTTVALDRRERARWQAWNLSLKGAKNAFLMYDPDRQHPLAYGKAVLGLPRASGGLFDGTATIDAVTPTTATLSGLVANYLASDGDHVSIQLTTGRRTVHMVQEPVAASSGGVVTLLVEPPIIGTVSLVQPAQLVRARCTMRMVSFSAPATENPAAITFEAVEG